MSSPKTVVLWDVDGTLMRTGSLAGNTIEQGVANAIGRDVEGHGVIMAGKTDPQIAREVLRVLEFAEEAIDAHMPNILREIEAQCASIEEEIRVHGTMMPGIKTLLEALHKNDTVIQTLLTGNLAPNAAVKARAMGFDKFIDWDVGAFGSDREDRRQLVPLALERMRERGALVSPDNTWVIGDAENDLACARAGGAKCILVATGRYELAEIEKMGPDFAFEDLSQTDKVLSLLLG